MGYLEEARENHVKKKVEEALRSKMKHKALKECDHYASRYAECAIGKTISIVWQCRKQAKELNNWPSPLYQRRCLGRNEKTIHASRRCKGINLSMFLYPIFVSNERSSGI